MKLREPSVGDKAIKEHAVLWTLAQQKAWVLKALFTPGQLSNLLPELYPRH